VAVGAGAGTAVADEIDVDVGACMTVAGGVGGGVAVRNRVAVGNGISDGINVATGATGAADAMPRSKRAVGITIAKPTTANRIATNNGSG